MKGRLAPSPTGALHLGNARSFLLAWLSIRSRSGSIVLRIEDLDHPKNKPGAEAAIIEDLRWLGLDWDEGPFIQSRMTDRYAEALRKLPVYPCICTRKDVETVQSAPHQGEMMFYGGACRDRFASYEDAAAQLPQGRFPVWRFRVPDNTLLTVDDAFLGARTFDVSRMCGDFAVARSSLGAGYMLAAPVDDIYAGITEVVRGDDLLEATPCQMLIYRALGYPSPVYRHIPLITGPDGRRLAKRHGDTRIGAFREAGVSADKIVGWLAWTAGIIPAPVPIFAKKMIRLFDWSHVTRKTTVWTGSFDT